MDEEYLHAEDVKEITGLTIAALSQLRYRGMGPKFYKPTVRTVLYKRSEVIAWIEASAYIRTNVPAAL
jgi:predicted DNA-binding transcriptional regulator AlpA